MTTHLEVVDRKTGEVVHRVNVAGKSDRTIERVMTGMLINMDREKFLVREAEETPSLECAECDAQDANACRHVEK